MKRPIGIPIITVLIILLFVGAVAASTMNALHMETQICTVTDKDRTAKQDGGSDMRVYTSDCGTFVIADSGFDLRFNSADVYAGLQTNKRYQFTTRGYRVPFLSMFPNIVKVQEV